MVQTMLRLLGIITLAFALAFAFGTNAQAAHDCPFAAVAMDHNAPDAMAHHAHAQIKANPSPGHSPPSVTCKHACASMPYAIATMAPFVPDTPPATIRMAKDKAAPSLVPVPSERPPKHLT